MPALRAASRPTITAPVTEASASWPLGEYRQALRVHFLRGDRSPDRQFDTALTDRPRGTRIGPQGAFFDGAIGLGKAASMAKP